MLKVIVKSYGLSWDLTKLDPLSSLKTLFVNYFVNQKIEYMQKVKTTVFMKLTAVTAK